MQQKQRMFVISDLHLGHENILKHRTNFKTIEEHDNHIINTWNKVVTPVDKVYILGDVAWRTKDLHKIGLLNGKKTLIAGNHDIFKTKDYLKYFRNVRGLFHKDPEQVWLSHAPIHPDELRGRINIHGHVHNNDIIGTWSKDFQHNYIGLPDLNYRNVCCEAVNYIPQLLEDVINGRIKRTLSED